MRAAPKPLAMAAVVALICSTFPRPADTLFAQQQSVPQPAPAVAYSQFMSVKPGPLNGLVLYTDGQTPAAQVLVRVWSVEQAKFVLDITTDDKGAYQISELAPGRYFVVFGDRVYVDLRVDEKAQFAGGPLNVIIPRGEVVFAQMAPDQRFATLKTLGNTKPEGEQAAIAGVPLRTLLIVGGGTATAVGTVVAINALGEEHEHHASP